MAWRGLGQWREDKQADSQNMLERELTGIADGVELDPEGEGPWGEWGFDSV